MPDSSTPAAKAAAGVQNVEMFMNSSGIRAAKESAAVFDLSQRSHLRLTGTDRVKFLHNFCTNDIKKLSVGAGCEAFICNAKGRTLGHVTVFAEQDVLWLETVPNAGAALQAHLDRYVIREDVAVQDVSAEFSEIAFVGPEAIRYLASAINLYELAEGMPMLLDRIAVPGIVCLAPLSNLANLSVRIVDWLGQRMYLLFGPRRLLSTLLNESVIAGAERGTAPDWESLRIDAGFPMYGVDITDENLPQEAARNERCISFTKGCYLGQEPIARLDALGHTNRELRRLRIDSEQAPGARAAILDAVSDESVGIVTSAARSPTDEGCAALGYLKTKWTRVGTQVRVAGGDGTVVATVR